MGAIFQDFKYGLRALAKNPEFSLIAILTLALGIGANTAMFSVIYGVLVRPLPFPQPERLVRLTWPGSSDDLTAEQFKFYHNQSTVFESTGAYRGPATVKLQTGKSVQWINILSVTRGFLPTLGTGPALGRNFDADEERAGGPEAVILTHELWQQAFGSDPDVIGRQVSLADENYTVAGVLPQGFQFVDHANAFVPLRFVGSAADLGSNTSAFARLKTGVKLAEARAAMAVVFKEYARVHGSYPGESGVALIPFQAFLTGDYRPSLLMLFGTVGFLLLIACANVASLLIARASSRQKEISVRLALGASRLRLLRQFLVESILLSTAGGAGGILAAVWMLRGLITSIPWDLPATDHIGLDVPVLFFALLVSLAASMTFGLASFFQTSRLDLNSNLKEGWSRGSGGAHSGVRKVIVTGELALSLMMLIGAGLLIESLHNLYRQNTGFEERGLYAVVAPLDKARAATAASVWNFDQAVLERMQAVPGVKSAAAVNELPVASQFNIPVQRAGHPEESVGAMQFRTASPGLFATMGVVLLRGRTFTNADTGASHPVILVSESLARLWWGEQNPIGDHIVVGMYRGQSFADLIEPARTVVGVVGDVRAMGLDAPMHPTVYIPVAQAQASLTDWLRSDVFLVRMAGGGNVAPDLRRAITDVDATQRVMAIEPMSEVIGDTVSRPRFNSLLLGLFAGLALFLTSIGLYGVIAYWAAHRTHEIGVRMALGAQKNDVLKMVVGQGLRLVAIGIAIGITGALALTRFLSSMLFEVKPTDPLTFIAVSLILTGVSLAASYIPARRAAKVDPMAALRCE